MAKPRGSAKKAVVQPEERSPRLVRAGDRVQMKGSQATEVVRDVSLVLHLANGVDEVYKVDEPVLWLPPEEVPDIPVDFDRDKAQHEQSGRGTK